MMTVGTVFKILIIVIKVIDIGTLLIPKGKCSLKLNSVQALNI